MAMSEAAESAKLARRVRQLEKKVATLNVLNGALREENEELGSRLEDAKRAEVHGGKAGGSEAEEVEELKLEFAERLASLENKLIEVTEQRDELKEDERAARTSLEEYDAKVS